MPSEDIHISFEDVSKSYNQETLVVRHLDLDVYRHEFLTLLGPSGSGKTTCLFMLAGFEKPSSGTIRIEGKSVESIPPHKREIGMVFQNYALFPHMSVAKNLSFPLEVRGIGVADRDEKVKRALALVRLEGLGDRKPSELSGGQQQRVAIARALVYEPSVVLMDEPLGALDRSLREEMQYEIRRIQRSVGVTVVYVTHDQTEAMVLSDRVAVFNDGRIEQIAPPEVLYEEPQRVFVSQFIGDNNQLQGTVQAIEEGHCSVRVGDSIVTATKVGNLELGSETTISIRPERVALQPTEDVYSNLFDALVDDIVFLGDHLRLSVTVCGVSNFAVKIPNMAGHGAVLPGNTVKVGWATLDCRALDPVTKE